MVNICLMQKGNKSNDWIFD